MCSQGSLALSPRLVKGSFCQGVETQQQTTLKLGNTALGALIFSSLAALSLQFILVLLSLQPGPPGSERERCQRGAAAASCRGEGIFNTMPEKNELVSSTLQSKSACEEALEEREARACLSTKALWRQSHVQRLER